MQAVILFSHGSVLCGAGEALEAHAERLRARGVAPIVEIGYLNYSEPSFANAVATCAAAGATRIVVVPYFLIPGYFVGVALPKAVQAAQLAYPDLSFTVAEPIGFEPTLADALIASAAQAIPPAQWRGEIVRASRSCRANPQCPLYGTADCPRQPVPPVDREAIAV